MRKGIFLSFQVLFCQNSELFILFHSILTWCHFHLDFNLSSASEDGWMRRRRLIRCLTISQLNVQLYDVQTMVLLCIVIWLCLVLNFAKQYPNWMSNSAWLWLNIIRRADYVIYGRLWYFSYCFTVHSNVALSCTKLCQTISQLNVQLCLTLTFSPFQTVRVSGND